MTPPLGSLWQARSGTDNTWRATGVMVDGSHQLELTATTPQSALDGYVVGDHIYVEPQWFELRGVRVVEQEALW